MITIQDPVVQVRFTSDEGYSDAINLSLEDHAALKDGDLLGIAAQRVADWKSFVTEQSMKVSPEPTDEEIQAQLAQIIEDRQQLNILEADLKAKLSSDVITIQPAEILYIPV